MAWTNDQQKVIKLRDKNILVSAAAGSGKTAVLVERIIKLVTDADNPVDVDRLLVATFTNAAAAEMKDRIRKALEKALAEDPTNKHLIKQQTLIHNAHISTIDSFCIYVVRNYFYTIDLEPDFGIASNGDLALLKQQVFDELWQEYFEKEDEEFLKLYDAYGSNNEEDLKGHVVKIYNMARSFPWPEEWLEMARLNYSDKTDDEIENSIWMEKNVELFVDKVRGYRQCHATLLENASEYVPQYVGAIADDIEYMDGILNASGFDAIRAAVAVREKWPAIGRVSKKDEVDTQWKESISGARAATKAAMSSDVKKYFSCDISAINEQNKFMAPTIDKFIEIVLEFSKRFDAAKREKNVADFNDIEHFAHRILVDEKTKEPTDVARGLQDTFDYIMVDEYQDSNFLQEDILKAVTGETRDVQNYFMVGDVKQSIYRFRQATPELFKGKYHTFVLDEDEGDDIKVNLSANFRSREEVVDFCNEVFEPIMQFDLGGVAYDDEAKLYHHAEYKTDKSYYGTEIYFIDSSETGEVVLEEISDNNGSDNQDFTEDEEAIDLEKRLLEPTFVAGKIKDMIEEGFEVYDKDNACLRPMNYGDVVILLRTVTGRANDFVEALAVQGIPAYTESSAGYFDTSEVNFMLNLLAVLDNPYQDIALASVLKSEIFGFDNNDFAKIKLENKDEKSFAKAFFKYVNSKEHFEEKKYRKFVNYIHDMRCTMQDLSVHEIIEQIYEDTKYVEHVSMLPGGANRAKNLYRLIDLALEYEDTNAHSLSQFIHYIDEIRENNVDFGLSGIYGAQDNAVCIMSIHKSKGLEFPVVFISDVCRNFHTEKDPFIVHPTYGIAMNFFNNKTHAKAKTYMRNALVDLNKLDEYGELQRLLYVAVTRAKEKLIITGTPNGKFYDFLDQGKVFDREYVSVGEKLNAKCFGDWIVLSLHSSNLFDAYVNVVFKNDIQVETTKDAEKKLELRAKLEAEVENCKINIPQTVKEQLEFEYPYEQENEYRNKYSVSDIKHVAIENYMKKCSEDYTPERRLGAFDKPFEPIVPSFISEKERETESAGATYGTAIHRVMECFDFAREDYADSLEEQLNIMTSRNLLTLEQRGIINKKKLSLFFKSDLAERMHKAAKKGDLYKEQRFVLGASPKEIFGDEDSQQDMVLIQGIIDVFFFEDGKLILLDYKTDKVEKEEQLASLYKTQIDLYSEALGHAYSCEVEERILYSFCLDTTVEL